MFCCLYLEIIFVTDSLEPRTDCKIIASSYRASSAHMTAIEITSAMSTVYDVGILVKGNATLTGIRTANAKLSQNPLQRACSMAEAV